MTSYRVFNIPHYFPVHNEAEVVVGIKDCGAAIRELKQVIDDFHIPLNYITEVSCDVSTSFNLECCMYSMSIIMCQHSMYFARTRRPTMQL